MSIENKTPTAIAVPRLVRVRYATFASKEAALCAGYADAEQGTWLRQDGSEDPNEWIGLETD